MLMKPSSARLPGAQLHRSSSFIPRKEVVVARSAELSPFYTLSRPLPALAPNWPEQEEGLMR